MRPLGVTLAVLLAAPAAWAQVPPGAPVPPAPPGASGVPVTPPRVSAVPPASPAAGVPGAQPAVTGAPAAQPPAADPRLDAHLNGWQKQMGSLINFRADFELTKRDATFQRDRKYRGSILVMKPNFARLRQDSAENKEDYEAFICNGRFLYEYNGLRKEITEYKMASNPAAGGDNLMLDMVSGMKADDAKRRFHIALFNEDPNYVYLDIKPVLAKDREEFKQVRFALYGPNVKAPYVPYLPAQAYLVKPNGDAEIWKFNNAQTNLPGVDPKVFEFVKIPGWTFKQAQVPPPGAAPRPGMPPALPGGPGLPPGPGVVKRP